MKNFVFLIGMVAFIVGGGTVLAQNSQSMPGLQTFFPPQGHGGLKSVPTVQNNGPVMPYTVLRPPPFHSDPSKGKFYSLNPLPQATPLRNLKVVRKAASGPVTVLGPRDVKYHSLYQDPTPSRARAPLQ